VARCAESRCSEACRIARRSLGPAVARSSRGRLHRPSAQTEKKRCQGDVRGRGDGQGAERVDRGRCCLPEPVAFSSG
jgi:hypothetical protein